MKLLPDIVRLFVSKWAPTAGSTTLNLHVHVARNKIHTNLFGLQFPRTNEKNDCNTVFFFSPVQQLSQKTNGIFWSRKKISFVFAIDNFEFYTFVYVSMNENKISSRKKNQLYNFSRQIMQITSDHQNYDTDVLFQHQLRFSLPRKCVLILQSVLFVGKCERERKKIQNGDPNVSCNATARMQMATPVVDYNGGFSQNIRNVP